MGPVIGWRRRALAAAIVLGTIMAGVATARAQSVGQLNRKLDAIEPLVNEGATNASAASDAISQLDAAESEFAQIAEGARSTGQLLAVYDRLEGMLDRMYTTYQRRKDECIEQIDNGGNCDYTESEQLALRALYPLSWLRFEGAGLYGGEPAAARRLLQESIEGFTASTLIIVNPELVRENMLGRAFAERELGKYQHAEYANAAADFKKIMAAGSWTRQYRPAEQGLATTYAAMGKIDQAQGMTARLASGATGAQRRGLEMLRLRELFKQEQAAADPAKRAALHGQIVGYARDRQNDPGDWAVVVATAADSLSDPVAEFGSSNDPFEDWLLANILYYKHRPLPAANYYWAAARSGKYPKAWKYAADLFYSGGRVDMVGKVAEQIAGQPRNPDAQWASYILYKIPRLEWERGGKRDAALQKKWIAAAQAYLKRYPRGKYAFEPRFRLGEHYQSAGDFAEAADQYGQVSGNPDYDYTARYNAAECYYRALEALEKARAAANGGKPPPAGAERDALRKKAIDALASAVQMEPGAERALPSAQQKALRDSRGRAIYMLAALLEQEPKVDYARVAALLANYEAAYPAMSAKFDEVVKWRMAALDRTAQYAELDREAAALAAKDAASSARDDYIKEVGMSFWHAAKTSRAAGDNQGYLENAKLTAITYGYFARQADEGKIPVKDLTGTLSVLGEAYLAINRSGTAEATFKRVIAADPASPDANAGLARIAQARDDYKDALDLWSRVESVAAESDSLFFEAKYNMAQIFADEGNVAGACNKLAVTRSEHPNLGSPQMKERWGDLQRKLCGNRTEG